MPFCIWAAFDRWPMMGCSSWNQNRNAAGARAAAVASMVIHIHGDGRRPAGRSEPIASRRALSEITPAAASTSVPAGSPT